MQYWIFHLDMNIVPVHTKKHVLYLEYGVRQAGKDQKF